MPRRGRVSCLRSITDRLVKGPFVGGCIHVLALSFVGIHSIERLEEIPFHVGCVGSMDTLWIYLLGAALGILGCNR